MTFQRLDLAKQRLTVFRYRCRGSYVFALRYAYGREDVSLEAAMAELCEDLRLVLGLETDQ